MTKTMLENLYRDALTLMERMRDYVARDARRDRLAAPWSERMVMLQANRVITVRLCHALQLIQAHQARLMGDDEVLALTPPRIRLAPVPVEQWAGVLPPHLAALAADANHLFERLHAVHIAIVPGDAGPFEALSQEVDMEPDAEDERLYA